MNRFRDQATGRDYPEMPEGVAGEEWHPEAYQSSKMWADVEQRLHDILRNPPKVYADPQTDAQKQEQYEAMFAQNPQLIQEQMRGETLRAVAEGRTGEKEEAQRQKSYVNAVNIAKGKEKTWRDMVSDNQKNPDTWSAEELETAMEAYNASLRYMHKTGGAAGYEGLDEMFPEVAKTGRTKAMERQLKEKKVAQQKETGRIMGGPFQDYGPEVIFEVQPGPGSEQESYDRLSKIDGAGQRAVARGIITKKKWDAAVTSITKEATAEARLRKARTVLQGNPEIMRILEEELLTDIQAQAPARMPQSFGAGGEQAVGTLPDILPGEGAEEPPPSLPFEQRPALGSLEKIPKFVGRGDAPIVRVE